MTKYCSTHLFILGGDYHLGDLLWFTAVLRDFRRKVQPEHVIVTVPDRPISHILQYNPLIDELRHHQVDALRNAHLHSDTEAVLHDLRPAAIGRAMMRQWRRRLPWLYYRDLWLEPRGQWLATFLGLGKLSEFRPVIQITTDDRRTARDLLSPYVVLAPHIGHYKLPLAGAFWRKMKGWPMERWTALAERLRAEGYEPLTLAAAGQDPIPGTDALMGLPIRQVAGIIDGAAALITVESGLWFVAAALGTPFVIVRWWLPRAIDWPGPLGVPHARIFPGHDTVDDVQAQLRGLLNHAEG